MNVQNPRNIIEEMIQPLLQTDDLDYERAAHGRWFLDGPREPVRMEQARKAIITAVEGVLPAHADGETLCTQEQRLEIELLPSQIDVVCLPSEAVE